jgi:hypothetical protein
MEFDDNYWTMMRANLKMTGMPDAQIDAMIQMQKSAMQTSVAADAIASANVAAQNRTLSDLFSDEPEFSIVEHPLVSLSYQWAIACGADLGFMRGDILNDIPTDPDADKEFMQDMLSSQWGIESHDDAIEMCDSLLAGRHSKVYNAAAQTLTGEKGKNIKAALAVFEKDGLISGNVPNMLIWDLGRLANVCRFALEAGWLTRVEVLHYLRELAPMVQGAYTSWREMSVAYQFGRAVWGGVDPDDYEEMKSGMEALLTNDASPWKKLPFDLKLDF